MKIHLLTLSSLFLLSACANTPTLLDASPGQKTSQKSAPEGSTVMKAPEKIIPTGYDDTPMIPNTQWRVHDDTRPRPKVVRPGRIYGEPPSDAIILFDGKDLAAFEGPDGATPDWIVSDGIVTVPPRAEGAQWTDIMTRQKFGDVQLHIEWRTPANIVSNSQGRGNSGVIFFGKYEVQVLDSYNNKSYADGQASSLYGWKPPLVNASAKPGEWQSYDIIFEAPRFSEAGELMKKAYVTVLHNGVLTQHRQAYLGESTHKIVGTYEPHEAKGYIRLQDHANPISYRNIWVRELDLDSNE